MCDLRRILTIKFDDGKLLDVHDDAVKFAHAYSYPCENSTYLPLVTEPGFYSIAASGSGYGYFTGEKWLHEHNGYEVVEWEDHDGYHNNDGMISDD